MVLVTFAATRQKGNRSAAYQEVFMTISRRSFLHLAAGGGALPVLSRTARAQAYPSRPVHIIVPFAAAGPNDIVARVVCQWLSEHLAQPFVIENRPGAGSNIGTEMVVHSPPDGYTVLLVSVAHAINATLYEKLSFSFIHDIAPVAGVMRAPNVMVVNPALPVRSVREFIDYGIANPGKLNFASSGIGASNHMGGELFKALTGLDMMHVPYRSSGPALTDLISGQVQVMFDSLASAIGYVKTGQLRPLGVTTATKADALPEIPVIADVVPGYELSNWFGFGMPRGTPPDVVMTFNKAVNEAVADPKLKARLAELGGILMHGSPADFGKLIAEETEKWGKVIRTANIKPE
jgi:tripartite-type tricarboxylate transporter receptor subunit TctC